MIRVLIADRHAGVRSGLRELMAEAPDLTLAGEVSSAGELLALCHDTQWDVALMDVAARDQSGQESLRAVRRQCPGSRLLALTFGLDYTFLQECLSAGAAGLIVAEDLPDELLPAIRAVHAGQVYLSRGVQRALDAGPSAHAAD